jgi:hypothetical protein
MDINALINQFYILISIIAGVATSALIIWGAIKYIRDNHLTNRSDITRVVALVVILIIIVGGLSFYLVSRTNGVNLEELYTQDTSGNPLFLDSLNRQDFNNWDEYDNTSYGCVFKGGAYHVYALVPHVTECYDNATNFRDVVFQVQMTIINGDGGGLIFGSGGANSKEYRFDVGPDRYYDLFIPQDANRVRAGTNVAINPALNKANKLTAIISKDTIYLYVNGKYIDMFNVSDGTNISGKIGLFSTSGKNPTEVVFSDAQVWTL